MGEHSRDTVASPAPPPPPRPPLRPRPLRRRGERRALMAAAVGPSLPSHPPPPAHSHTLLCFLPSHTHPTPPPSPPRPSRSPPRLPPPASSPRSPPPSAPPPPRRRRGGGALPRGHRGRRPQALLAVTGGWGGRGGAGRPRYHNGAPARRRPDWPDWPPRRLPASQRALSLRPRRPSGGGAAGRLGVPAATLSPQPFERPRGGRRWRPAGRVAVAVGWGHRGGWW